MSTYEEAQTRHANTMDVYADGEVVGEAVNCQWSEDPSTAPVHVIGTIYPIEHLHDRWAGQLSVEMLVFKEPALKKYQVGDIVKLPTLNFMVVDRVDNATVWSALDCTLSGRSGGLSANQRVQTNLRFLPLKVVDDSGEVVAGDTEN